MYTYHFPTKTMTLSQLSNSGSKKKKKYSVLRLVKVLIPWYFSSILCNWYVYGQKNNLKMCSVNRWIKCGVLAHCKSLLKSCGVMTRGGVQIYVPHHCQPVTHCHHLNSFQGFCFDVMIVSCGTEQTVTERSCCRSVHPAKDWWTHLHRLI